MINTDFSAIRNGKWIEIPEIKKIANQLVERYKYQSEQYDILKQENDKLKNLIWEKEEIANLKEELNNLKKLMSFNYLITEEENEKIKKWISKRPIQDTGAIGGRYEYRFFPTGLGVIGKVVDMISGESFTFRELK